MTGAAPSVWHDVAAYEALAEGGLAPFEVEGTSLVLYRIGAEVYATQAVCTHGSADLADGELDGCEVICPFHAGRFDVTTGAAVSLPCTEALTVYPVQVVRGRVQVSVPDVFGSAATTEARHAR